MAMIAPEVKSMPLGIRYACLKYGGVQEYHKAISYESDYPYFGEPNLKQKPLPTKKPDLKESARKRRSRRVIENLIKGS
jgi:hypothetical protein